MWRGRIAIALRSWRSPSATNVAAMVKQILEFRPCRGDGDGRGDGQLRRARRTSAEISGVGNEGCAKSPRTPTSTSSSVRHRAPPPHAAGMIDAGKTIALARKCSSWRAA
jgi:hypothetical protein